MHGFLWSFYFYFLLEMSTVYKLMKRKTWEKDEMSAAIVAVREKTMGYQSS